MNYRSWISMLVLGASVACGTHKPGGMSGPTLNNRISDTPRHPLESDEILNRATRTERALIKHILIGWGNLESAYDTPMEPRALERSRAQAERLIRKLLADLDAGAVFEALMLEYSEDPASAKTAKAYEVAADVSFEKRFIALALRLEVGEWGVVRTRYGLHIIRRIK